MRYCFDIDGTICTPTIGRDYHLAEPFYDRIEIINELYEREHYIIYFTARGMGRFAGAPDACLLYTSPSPRDKRQSRMPSSA